MFDLYLLEKMIWPISLLAISISIGVLLEIFFTVKLKRILAKNNWLKGGQILKAFRGITFIIFLGIGIYLFVHTLSIEGKIGEYLSKSVMVALMLSSTILLSRVAVAYVTYDSDKTTNDVHNSSIIINITRIVVFSIGIVVILQSLGISVTPILTALGVGGIAVALALQDTLSNLFAGIFIITSNKVRVGDYVKLQSGEEGFIEDISWRTITIKETTDTMVVVPNSKLSTAIYKNFDLPVKDLLFPVQLTVSFDNDMHLVEKICLETATIVIEKLPQCVKGHVPVVRFHTFTGDGLQFGVVFRITEAIDQGPVRHEFIKEALKAFRENGIQVSERAITLRNKTTPISFSE